VFELDLVENAAYKEQRPRRIYRGLPENVALVPVDFEADELNVALGAHGSNPQQRPVFVWEAVTQYLTEHGVRQTLAYLSMINVRQSGGLRRRSDAALMPSWARYLDVHHRHNIGSRRDCCRNYFVPPERTSATTSISPSSSSKPRTAVRNIHFGVSRDIPGT